MTATTVTPTRRQWLAAFAGVLLMLVVFSYGGGTGPDWKLQADNALTCGQITQVIDDYTTSGGELSDEATRGYLTARAGELCG